MGRFKDFMERDINDPKLLVGFEEDWIDAIEAQGITNLRQETPLVIKNELHRHIYRRLGNIAANPNEGSNTQALVESYIFAVNSEQCVNTSEKSVYDFVIEMIKRSRRYQRISDYKKEVIDRSGRSSEKSHAIITGDRGTGKSHFINFILSKYSKLFDDSRVIFVKIDLVKDFDNFETLDLTHWIMAKASKVILRYYDRNQKKRPENSPPPTPLDIEGPVLEYIYRKIPSGGAIERNIIEYIDRIRGKFDCMVKTFRDLEGSTKVSADEIPKDVAETIFDIALKSGYTFIVVLDGLDRLDVTIREKNKFEAILNKISRLLDSDDSSRFMTIITSRTRTMSDLSASASHAPWTNRGHILHATIGVPALEEIIIGRLEFIKKEIDALPYKSGMSTVGVRQKIENFEQYLLRSVGKEKSRISMLSQHLGTNRRAQVQMVQLSYYDFLFDTEGKGYILTESLLKAGLMYPLRHYSYRSHNNSSVIRLNGPDESLFDSKFLPTIFSFPCLGNSPSTDRAASYHGGQLLGIRIAQLVLAYKDLNQDNQFNLFGREVCEILNKLFGYNEDSIYLVLEEFAEFELIQLDGSVYQHPPNRQAYHITPMPKLEYMIDSFIRDIAYINLASMRMPLLPRIIRRQHDPALGDKMLFINAYAIEDTKKNNDFDRKLAKWCLYKITNSIGTVRLLRYINSLQEKMMADNINKISKSDRTYSIINHAISDAHGRHMFKFIGTITNEIESQAESILSVLKTRDPRGHDFVERLIDKYINDWQNI